MTHASRGQKSVHWKYSSTTLSHKQGLPMRCRGSEEGRTSSCLEDGSTTMARSRGAKRIGGATLPVRSCSPEEEKDRVVGFIRSKKTKKPRFFNSTNMETWRREMRAFLLPFFGRNVQKIGEKGNLDGKECHECPSTTPFYYFSVRELQKERTKKAPFFTGIHICIVIFLRCNLFS